MELKKRMHQLGTAIILSSVMLSPHIQSKESEGWNYKHKQSDNIISNQNTTPDIKKSNQPTFDKKHLEHRKLDEEYLKIAKKYSKENQKEKAIEYYKKAIEFNANNLLANFDIGCLLYADGKPKEAIEYYKKAIEIDPNCSQAYFNVSLCYMQTKDEEKAIQYLKTLLEIKPDYAKAYRQLGLLLQKNKKDEEAVHYLKKATSLNETFDLLILTGRSLKNLDRIEESMQYFRKAKEKNPENVLALLELANTLNIQCKGQKDLEEALALYKKVLEKDPSLNSVRYNIAYTLKRLDRVEESLKYYKESVKANPEYAQARFSLGLAHLVLGDFDHGWPEYEYRWQAYKETPKKYEMPIWDGSNPAGKTILVCAEQGLGDSFQFIRYTQILKRLGATVVFETQKALKDVFSLCPYIDKVIPRGTPIPTCDYQIYLLSLPLKFKTTVDTVPDHIPYLKANPELVDYWREQLSPDKNFKIGVCWQGNRFYRTQALQHAVSAKSISLKLLKPLADIPGVSLYSLQKMSGEDQLKDIDFDLHVFDKDFDDSHGRFMDTAAVIKNLDLVISVDTSICHLAAALGAPVWNMLPKPADWRWLLKTQKTPWYPNMKLFRQKNIGDWEGLVQTVAAELLDVVNKTRKKTETKTTTKAQPKQPKSTPAKNNDPIVFYDVKDMVFEDMLDKIIVLNIKYEQNKDAKLLDEIQKVEDALEHMSSVYKTNHDRQELDQLADKLCSANRELLEIEKQTDNLDDKSMFNPIFIESTKKAQYIHNLKKHIKEQIKNLVDPR